MFIRELDLRDFRSWPSLSLSLKPGVSIFVGRNGFGKTNIVEALGYLAHLSSHRIHQDAPLIRAGHDNARISATAVNEGRELTSHLLIKAKGTNQAQINRTRLKSSREILGVVRTVLFAPEDLALVRGEPAERRRYLDDIIASQNPRLAGVKADYDKVLRQRTALLKSAGHALRRGYNSEDGASALSTLDVWDAQLAALGAQVIVAREEIVEKLHGAVHDIYARIAPESRPASLRYSCSVDIEEHQVELIEAQMLSALGEKRNKEIERGQSLVGPHRDDLEVNLGEHPAKGFASHGETWSMAIALRFAEFELLTAAGSSPVLILDDVFAELDAQRRQRIVELTEDVEQVLITAAVDEDLPGNLEEKVVDRFHIGVEHVDGARVSVLRSNG